MTEISKPKWPGDNASDEEKKKYQEESIEYLDHQNNKFINSINGNDHKYYKPKIQPENPENLPAWIRPFVAGDYVTQEELLTILPVLGKTSKLVAGFALSGALVFKIAGIFTAGSQKELKAGEDLAEIVGIASEALSGYAKEKREDLIKELDSVNDTYRKDFGQSLQDKDGKWNLELTLIILTFYNIYNTYIALLIIITIGAFNKIDNINNAEARKFINLLEININQNSDHDIFSVEYPPESSMVQKQNQTLAGELNTNPAVKVMSQKDITPNLNDLYKGGANKNIWKLRAQAFERQNRKIHRYNQYIQRRQKKITRMMMADYRSKVAKQSDIYGDFGHTLSYLRKKNHNDYYTGYIIRKESNRIEREKKKQNKALDNKKKK